MTTETAFHQIVDASRGYDIPPYENCAISTSGRPRARPKASTTIIHRAAISSRHDRLSGADQYREQSLRTGHDLQVGRTLREKGMSMDDAISRTAEEIEGYKRV